MVDPLVVVVALPVVGWLVLKGLDWWERGSCSRDLAASCLRGMDTWRGLINERRAALADMQTPGWYDRQWPVCDDLEVSTDQQYCCRCYRPVWRHATQG